MPLAESTAFWALDLCVASKCCWIPCGFHIPQCSEVMKKITRDEDPGLAVVRTELMKVYLPPVAEDLCGNDSSAGATGRLSHTQNFHQCLFTET